MSKGNMLLGHARGKVGSLVFSRVNGKQVTRTRAEVVKNPRTLAQQIQRVFMNTASQAYAYTKAIADHSFQGKAAGQECMSAFMKANLEYMRERVAQLTDAGNSMDEIFSFVPVGLSGLYPGAWIISKGQLPRIQTVISPYTGEGSAKAKIAIGTNTYEGVLNALKLQRGDQLTLVTCEQDLTDGENYFSYARIILDPREANGDAADLSTAFIADGAIQKPNSKNEGSFGSLEFVGSDMVFTLIGGDVASAGAIASRMEDDTWKRSSCQMVVNEDVITNGNAYSLAGAIAASKGVSIDVVNALYLNNAGEGGTQGDVTPAPQPSSDPTYNSTVQITANGAVATQNISGGVTTVASPLTKVVVSGANLNNADLKAGTTNNAAAAAAMTLSNNNTVATWEGNAVSGNLYVFKGSTLWFTLDINAGGADGN